MTLVEVPRPRRAPPTARLRVLHMPSSQISAVRVTRLPIRLHSYAGAVALPMVEASATGRVLGTVYDRDGHLVRGAQRARPGPRWRSNPERLDDLADRARDAVELSGRAFLGGQRTHVFGHVLLETLARFWRPVDYTRYDHVILYPHRPPRQIPFVTDVAVEVLGLVGVERDRICIVGDRPLRFEKLDVGAPPIRMKSAVDPRLLAVFDRIGDALSPIAAPAGSPAVSPAGSAAGSAAVSPAGSPTGSPSRVYLSRSRLADRRRATNEAAIEELMQRRGFAVVHPQEVPVVEQVRLVRAAEVIAGCDGSALHLAAFARPGTRLLALDSRATPNQLLIDLARGLDAVHVDAHGGAITSRTDAWVADLGRVEEALDLVLG